MALKSLRLFMNHSLVMAMGLMLCKTTQYGRVIVESSDKMWSTGGGTVKPLQYSCHENPMNNIRQKDMILKDEFPRSISAQYATRDSGEITPERMKRRSQSETMPSGGCDW